MFDSTDDADAGDTGRDMTCEGVEGDSGDMKGSSKRSAALG
jgi:hypothetical protein